MVPVVSVPDFFLRFMVLFANLLHRPEMRHLVRYCLGLCVSVNKTISGIMFDSRHPSSVSRFFSAGKWDERELNRQRLASALKRLPECSVGTGNLVLDETVRQKYGTEIEGCGWHYDSKEGREVWGHCYVSSVLVQRWWTLPVDLRLYVRAEACPAGWEFKDKNEILRDIVRLSVEAGLPFDCVLLDSWFVNADNCRFIEKQKKSWIGQLKKSLLVEWQGKELRLEDWYAEVRKLSALRPLKTKPFDGEVKTYYVYSRAVVLKSLGKIKLIISHQDLEGKDEPTFIGTNRQDWESALVLTRYGYRWQIETLHQDLTGNLGLGECEMRSLTSVGRHAQAVLMSATLLDLATRESGLWQWTLSQRRSLGEKQRILLWQVLRQFILWVLKFVSRDEQPVAEKIFSELQRHLCYSLLPLGGDEMQKQEPKSKSP